MSTQPLALSNVVEISVSVAPSAASVNGFNQGLFIGDSPVIPSYGANSRLRQYTCSDLSGMLTDGFTTTDPEYIAATIYASQTPQPEFIWIGRQDSTALNTIALNVGGTGWAVGDQFDIVQAGASYGIGQVTTVNAGVATGVEIIQGGTAYSVATGLTTTAISPSTGTGLTVNVTAIGETLLTSAQACRAASNTWYGLSVYNPTLADNLALSQWADPLYQSTRYYPWSSNTDIPNNVTNNLAQQLQTLKLRVMGTYATTQNGLYPNNIYAAAAAMGAEMGRNTGAVGSFFSIAHKSLVGIAPEPLTQTQFTNIKNQGFNVYGNFDPFDMYEPAVMSNGAPSYLWMFLAMLVAQIQFNELNILTGDPSVRQTNADQHRLIQSCNDACDKLAGIGFLSGGVWQGAPLTASGLSLSTGESLPLGYKNQSQPYSQQSAADRDAGKAMPIYSAVITAGIVQSLLVAVYTQL